ncbi:MAG TPA: hypothetical protein VMB85_22905 [Bryobacteraceae bacterium]|nr:hypothetical protein [Bryobacteraceae bacterium]
MDTRQIVALLIAERDRLSRAIEALQGSSRRRGQRPAVASTNAAPAAAPVKPAVKKRRISAAGRKAIAGAARRRWAAVRGKKAEGNQAEGSAAPSEDEQFKRRMSEVMKASWAKRKRAAAKKKAA